MRPIHRRFFSTLIFLLKSGHHISASNITWTSPSSGDIFGPGDNIVSEWTADQTLSSPSFKLCVKIANSDGSSTKRSIESTADSTTDSTTDSSCGDSITPSVSQIGEKYAVTLAVPTVTKKASVYLRVQDGSGNSISSPEFSLSPTAVLASAENPPANSNPLGTNSTQSSVPPNAGYIPGAVSGNVADSAPKYLSSSHSSAPPAAIAVPLALVGITLLVSIALWARHRRSSARQHLEKDTSFRARPQRDKSMSYSSTRSNVNTITSEDIEKALSVLSEKRESHLQRIPSTQSWENDLDVPILLSQSRSEHFERRRPEPRRDVRREPSQMSISDRSETTSIPDSRATLPSRIGRTKSRSRWKLQRNLFASEAENEAFYDESERRRQRNLRRQHGLSNGAQDDGRGSVYSISEDTSEDTYSPEYRGLPSRNMPRQPFKTHYRPTAPQPVQGRRESLSDEQRDAARTMRRATESMAMGRHKRSTSLQSTQPGGVRLV